MIFLTYLFIACCIYQIVYQLVLIVAIINKKKYQNIKISSEVSEIKSVSVIICAKDEAVNLQKNLPFILKQNYPNFEVIIVDDGSNERLTMNDERLQIINLTKEEKIGLGKKYALQKGVEAAKNELILLTDADCLPASEYWISEMSNCIDSEHKIVLGISPYKTENSLLNTFIEYETAQTALQYIGSAILGNPYMCVGRNVLYDAALLKSKKWTNLEYSISSGDDDLAIQTLSTNKNTTVCLTENSYTFSEAKGSWVKWFKQKNRHYESGKLYKFSNRIFLGFYLISKLLFFMLLFYFIIYGISFLKSILVIYFIFSTILNFSLQKTSKLNSRWYFSIFSDFVYTIVSISLGLFSMIKPTKAWK